MHINDVNYFLFWAVFQTLALGGGAQGENGGLPKLRMWRSGFKAAEESAICGPEYQRKGSYVIEGDRSPHGALP